MASIHESRGVFCRPQDCSVVVIAARATLAAEASAPALRQPVRAGAPGERRRQIGSAKTRTRSASPFNPGGTNARQKRRPCRRAGAAGCAGSRGCRRARASGEGWFAGHLRWTNCGWPARKASRTPKVSSGRVGAERIEERSAGTQQRGDMGEDGLLQLCHFANFFRAAAPADLGIAPQDAKAAARGIDENPVETSGGEKLGGRVRSQVLGSMPVAPRRRAPATTRPMRCGCRSRATISARLPVRAARCVVLPPGAAQASRMRSFGCGASRWVISMLASSCTWYHPSRSPGSGEAPRAVRTIPSGA